HVAERPIEEGLYVTGGITREADDREIDHAAGLRETVAHLVKQLEGRGVKWIDSPQRVLVECDPGERRADLAGEPVDRLVVARLLHQDGIADEIADVGGAQEKAQGIAVLDLAVEATF